MHVPCKIVCTFCTKPVKVFDLASEFMRHWEAGHKDDNRTSPEGIYMQTKYDELERLVQERLSDEQADQSKGRKRIRGEEASGGPESHRAKLTDTSLTVDARLVQSAPAFDLGSTVVLPTQSTTAFTLVSNEEHVATITGLHGFASMSYPNAGSDNHTGIDAPLLRVFGSNQYNTGLSEDPWEVYGPGHDSNIL